jgi:hypothetical protein
MDDLLQHVLSAPTVEPTLQDSLPYVKVRPLAGHRDNNFRVHDLLLQVGISVVLTCTVVKVLTDSLVRGQALEPFPIVLQEALHIIIDTHGSRDLHGVHQAHARLDVAFA